MIKSQSQDIEGSSFAFDLWKPLQLVIKAIVIESIMNGGRALRSVRWRHAGR